MVMNAFITTLYSGCIIMVIHAFNTTLYSGWNIYQVSIFFIKRKPTITLVKVNIKKNLNTVRSM